MYSKNLCSLFILKENRPICFINVKASPFFINKKVCNKISILVNSIFGISFNDNLNCFYVTLNMFDFFFFSLTKFFLFSNIITKNYSVFSIFTHFLKIVQGALHHYSIKLKIIGLGFRIKLLSLRQRSILKINVGFSHQIYYRLPKTIFFYKKRRKYFILSTNLNILYNVITLLRNFRQLNDYKIKGIVPFIFSKKLKPGKRQQRF